MDEPTATSTASITLASQPSCLEFAKSKDLLLVGTYNLEPDQASAQNVDNEIAVAVEPPPQERTGSLLVFRVTELEATLLQTKSLSYAILDLHFSPSEPSTFAVATSVGSVCLFSLDLDRAGDLSLIRSFQVCDSSTLVLSLAYQIPDQIEKSPLIAVSLSNGHLAVLTEKQDEQDLVTFPGHNEAAWIVVWSQTPKHSRASQGLLYSGGDDSTLCKHNPSFPRPSRDNEGAINEYRPIHQDRSTHLAGVTAIVALPVEVRGEEILITGSFDDHIRVLSPPARSRRQVSVRAERDLGGGVWRISNPFSYEVSSHSGRITFRVLASCMHAGAKVLEIRKEADEWSIEVLTKFTEHESMNYASDVRVNEKGTTFVSTSFYDRKLCVWNLEGTSDSPHDVS